MKNTETYVYAVACPFGASLFCLYPNHSQHGASLLFRRVASKAGRFFAAPPLFYPMTGQTHDCNVINHFI